MVEGPDESRREAARDLATKAAEKAFDRDLIASEGACPPLVELCRRGATDETRSPPPPRPAWKSKFYGVWGQHDGVIAEK